MSSTPLSHAFAGEAKPVAHVLLGTKKRRISDLNILLRTEPREQIPSVTMYESVEQPGMLDALHFCFRCYAIAVLTGVLLYEMSAVIR